LTQRVKRELRHGNQILARANPWMQPESESTSGSARGENHPAAVGDHSTPSHGGRAASGERRSGRQIEQRCAQWSNRPRELEKARAEVKPHMPANLSGRRQLEVARSEWLAAWGD
jgi:hypothetical protein